MRLLSPDTLNFVCRSKFLGIFSLNLPPSYIIPRVADTVPLSHLVLFPLLHPSVHPWLKTCHDVAPVGGMLGCPIFASLQ
jgi:hypothetical protein